MTTPVTTITQLKALGFSDDVIEVPRRTIVSVSGREKSGKTHFSLTGPEPLAFFNIDIGTEGVVNKFQDQGRKPLVYDCRVPKKAQQQIYAAMWSDLKVRLQAAWRLAQGTIVIDTATECWELARLAHFGRLQQILPHNYTEVNTEWRELMKEAYDSRCSTILIHKLKSKWVNNVRTGEDEISGFAETPYLVQTVITVFKEEAPGNVGGMPIFYALITDCRQQPALTGVNLKGPMCNMEMLLALIHDK